MHTMLKKYFDVLDAIENVRRFWGCHGYGVRLALALPISLGYEGCRCFPQWLEERGGLRELTAVLVREGISMPKLVEALNEIAPSARFGLNHEGNLTWEYGLNLRRLHRAIAMVLEDPDPSEGSATEGR
jgi:hypothetical protein